MKTTIYTRFKGQPLIINIRCDDECKNGHDTFAITADLLRKNKCSKSHYDAVFFEPTGEYHAMEACGCLHDIILKVRPDLKPFVDLHLADGDGVPMYAVENGKYHMRNKQTFTNYLRLTDEQANEFYSLPSTGEWNLLFTQKIESMKPQWLSEANAAKELLKSLTK